MKNLKFILFFFGITVLSYAQGEVFTLSPEHPNPGDEITITYNAASGPLIAAKHIEGVIYTFDNFKWLATDVTFAPIGNNKWDAKMKLSEHASFINCVFKSDSIVDRGVTSSHGYLFAQVPGAYTGWGILRSRAFQDEVPNIVHDSAYIADEVGLMWIKYELQYHPKSRNKVFYYGLKLKQLSTGEDQSDIFKRELRFNMNEKDLDNTAQYQIQKSLSLMPQPASKAFTDSVQNVLLQRYPYGVLARDRQIQEIFKESDFDKKVQQYTQFEKNFPQEKFSDVTTEVENLYYDKMIKSIVYTYIVKNKDYNPAINSVKNVSYNILLDYAWHLVSIPFDRDHEGSEKASMETLRQYADVILPELERREQYVPKEYIGKLSLKEWKEKTLNSSAGEFFTYAKLLEVGKSYDLEKKYLEKIKPVFAYKKAVYNEVYTRMLLRDGKTAEAKEYLTLSFKENQVTPEMTASLKAIYLKEGGKPAGFDAYAASLKSSANMESHKKKLLSELINLPIESFELQSSKGGKINLAAQKGKIVVLDYWATWCGPCKNAMPGMQLAVNKYKDDPNVKFYFIDTMENSKDYKAQTQKFAKDKGFDFNILYDEINPKTGKMGKVYDKYAKTFHFSGIPIKMIVDQKGKVRWISNGYFGSPSELVDEISIIVSHLKKENK